VPTAGLDERVSHQDVAAFGVAKVNLRASDVEEQRAQVGRLRDRLEQYIVESKAYDLVKMLHSGSVAKGTALRTINDMDVAVYVKAASAPEDESKLLTWLQGRLKDAYGKLLSPEQFQVQRHCVTLSFRGSGLDVDVVPVIYEGEGDDYGYLIAKETGARVRTSIKLHLEFIRRRKTAQPTHFAQVVRLAKWWLRQRKSTDCSFRFKSFMMELLVAHLVDRGLDCSDYPEALQEIFAYFVKTELKQSITFSDFSSAGKPPERDAAAIRIYDPVNNLNNVAASYSDSDRRAIVEAANDAFDALTFARSASTKAKAIEQWREVFGTSFSA
jgi:tRNA nucleotidyltransferase (CCA-adding enzyme)